MNNYLLEKWSKWFDYCVEHNLQNRLINANGKICQFNYLVYVEGK